MKLLKAIFFSSFAIIPAYLIAIILSGDITNSLVVFSILVAYLIGVIVISVIGVPTHLILKALGVKSFLPYFLIAFLIPSLFTLWFRPFGEDGFCWIAWQGFLLGGFGVMCAYIFYYFINEKNT